MASTISGRTSGGRRRGGASLRLISEDSKLSRVERVPHGRGTYKAYSLKQTGPRVAATYVSIDKTCPSSCAFRGAGCFAESGFTRVLGQKLDLAAIGASGDQVAEAEAALIDESCPRGVPQDGARGGRDLRLHVGGDTPSARGARLLAGAAGRWRARGGGSVWTYTHRWRSIPRAAFGSISVLASVETHEDAGKARVMGYVPALVVERFPFGPRQFGVFGDGRGGKYFAHIGKPGFIPCPAEVQPGRVTCATCRLCMDDGKLRDRWLGIAFAVHGVTADRARAALEAA